jgi:hypothetical protein
LDPAPFTVALQRFTFNFSSPLRVVQYITGESDSLGLASFRLLPGERFHAASVPGTWAVDLATKASLF